MTFLFTEGGVGHRVASGRPSCFVGGDGARLSLFVLPDEGGVTVPHLLRLEPGVPTLQPRAELLARLLARAGLECGRVRGRVDAGARLHRVGRLGGADLPPGRAAPSTTLTGGGGRVEGGWRRARGGAARKR